jgi:hypothetical protein
MPNSAAAHFNLGIAQIKVGDHQGAIASNQRALQLQPEWTEAYNNLGFAFAGLKRWNEASQAFLAAIRIKPNYKGASFNLGIAYVELGQSESAKPLLEKLATPEASDLRARLANRIGGLDETGRPLPANVVAETPVSAPSPTPVAVDATQPQIAPTPQPQATERPQVTGTPANSSSSDVGKAPESEGSCPGPIYSPSDVTQKPTIISEIPAFFTEEALKNNVSGKIILQAFLCSTGRVSNITVEKSLAHGLTERATDLLKLTKFQPGLLDGKPVSVMLRFEFFCLEQTCKLVAQ